LEVSRANSTAMLEWGVREWDAFNMRQGSKLTGICFLHHVDENALRLLQDCPQEVCLILE
jgi:hypothetical protein